MGSDGDEATDIELEKSLRRPISTVVFVIGTLLFYLHSTDLPSLFMDQISSSSLSCLGREAMQAEAQPLVNKFGLSDSPPCVNKSFLSLGFTSKQQKSVIIMFDLYGVGLRQAFSTPNLLKDLNLKIGRLSTGDSLDMSTQDESLIIANDATLKDMEGAAVAYVAELLKVQVMFLKAVTDLIDGDKPTAEEFLQNLSTCDLCS
ncbi:hypothetical protein Bca101_080161 [Brassica carinata]